ncbi:MAG: cellulase family glycosylhydrolase [Vicingus serpentipes]|nr:cellulase family glycosylhydrolase [Vicingus serpentipes]
MRKFFLPFCGITTIFILIYLFLQKPQGFVSIKSDSFILNDSSFYPITLNYIVRLQANENDVWPCPASEYINQKGHLYTSKDSCLIQLESDMLLIKQLGFNTVRIVGIGEVNVDKDHKGSLSFRASYGNDKDSTFILTHSEKNYTSYFNAIEEMLLIIDKVGLKVIFLTRLSADFKTTENHLMRLAKRFKNNKTIMAFDIFNEPLYFDPIERPKKEAYHLAKSWTNLIKMYAPNHLSTIGLEGIREVFEWDPNILPVDFISYHPYEYEPEQVRNEIYWYGKYTKKPWIIGETAIPANNDSITYEEQRLFAKKTLEQAHNCGASGYSWWQYKDVDWGKYHASFMGIVNWEGETQVKKAPIPIQGTVKPVAQAFKEFDSSAKKGECLCLNNYYNYSESKVFRLKGKLVDNNNKPIQGGVILAWNEWWSHSYHTITKHDGSFELLGSYPFYHWMASATEYSMVRGDINPDTAEVVTGIPEINLSELQIKPLDFIN